MKKSTGLSFGQAQTAMQEGHKVTRLGWNGPDQWVAYNEGVPHLEAEKFWNVHARKHALSNGGTATVLPYYLLKTTKGQIQMGWVPSQNDLHANDWLVLP